MTESAFWRYSVAFYARPGVAQACLALQDEAGADVNVVLYMLFLAHADRALDAATVAAVAACARPWSDSIVVPLREVRRRLKGTTGAFSTPSTAALRTEVKRIELAAEHLLQATLESEFPVRTSGSIASNRAAAAAANLGAYATMLGLPPAPRAPLDLLLERFIASEADNGVK